MLRRDAGRAPIPCFAWIIGQSTRVKLIFAQARTMKCIYNLYVCYFRLRTSTVVATVLSTRTRHYFFEDFFYSTRTVQADLMIEMVTRISNYSRGVLSGQEGNTRNKNEFPSFKSWVEVSF